MTGLLGKFSREDGESGKDLPLRSKMVGHESTRRDMKMEMLLRNILATDLPLPAGRSHGYARIYIRVNR